MVGEGRQPKNEFFLAIFHNKYELILGMLARSPPPLYTPLILTEPKAFLSYLLLIRTLTAMLLSYPKFLTLMGTYIVRFG